MTKLKIAQIVNIWESVPPLKYGGTESVVYNICQGLSKKGHDVSLFASGDSKINGKLYFIYKDSLIKKNILWSKYLYALAHFTYAYNTVRAEGDYDIIHGHYSLASDLISLSFASLSDKPSVFTLHSPLNKLPKQDDRQKIIDLCSNLNYISISDKQRILPLNYVNTIYHGISTKEFPFDDKTEEDYMLWLGRIAPEKGLESSLNISLLLDKKIVVVGRIDKENEVNLNYFQLKIKPKLAAKNLTFIEEVNHKKRNELMMKAKVFLFPINWEEPFGLVMIEAMACGTPVVAFARGSVPEVIRDGETGFIVNSSEGDKRGDWIIKKTGIEGLSQAVERIYAMTEKQYKQMRKNCRAHVEKNFTVERMVDEYEKVYQKLLL